MIRISSYYIKYFRLFSLLVVLLNITGILFINLILPKEKAETYSDLYLNYFLIITFSSIFILTLNYCDVTLNKLKKEFIIKQFGKKEFIVKKENIESIENSFPFKCNIEYSINNEKKKIKFSPSLIYFPPFSNYKKIIEEILSS